MKIKRAGIGTKFVVLVLLAAVATALLSVQGQLKEAQAQRDLLSRQIREQQEVNAALANEIANSGEQGYLANVARSRLGLLEPDEICFVDASS